MNSTNKQKTEIVHRNKEVRPNKNLKGINSPNYKEANLISIRVEFGF